uniref:PDZ domain-containing protein n=1 Tax=Parascaris equorum TaxID=6256 RepID=A0A914R4U8_PAREQ
MRSVKKSKQAFTLKIHRLIWNVHAERLPEGYDRVPGYIYILGLMVKIPGADIGMNIRSFNSKVYVANVEQQSMAATSCLMGDCIVAVDNVPVSTVATCREKIVAAFTNNNFVSASLKYFPFAEIVVEGVGIVIFIQRKGKMMIKKKYK